MFATKDDMVKRFGEKEVRQLTDRNYTGAIDDQVLATGLSDADAEVCGYLAGRYTLPLVVTPRLLVGYACDIARYRLTGTDVQCTPDIETRYQQAIKYLGHVANGTISLGVDAAGAPVDGKVGTSKSARTSAGGRRFNADTMAGY